MFNSGEVLQRLEYFSQTFGRNIMFMEQMLYKESLQKDKLIILVILSNFKRSKDI